MKAKEKAIKLVEKFYNEIDCASLRDEISDEKAKQCALICIEIEYKSIRECLVSLKRVGKIDYEYYLTQLDYLIAEENQLKQEIKKL